MSDRSQYRRLCESEPTIPIFSRDWFLDATCGENNWDVALVEKGGEIKGSFPYQITKRYRQTVVTMPRLALTMGPWIRPSASKGGQMQSSSASDIISELIDLLPPFNYFNQNLHQAITNWLPFYWSGFHQTTYYTYVVPNLTDLGKVQSEFNRDTRRQIKQAEETVKASSSDDIAKFYEINSFVFQRQGLKVPYSLDYIQSMDDACRKRDCRRILVAKDENDQIHASLYFVWDEESAYALMSGIDPKFKDDGAMKLLFWEAIKISQGVTKQFNFAGSMLKPIVRSFRGFGTVQVPYSNLTKANGLVSKTLDCATRWSSSPRFMRWLGQRI